MKYSINAKNTKNVQQSSQTCRFDLQIEFECNKKLCLCTSIHFNSRASGELLRTVSNIVINDKSVVTKRTIRPAISGTTITTNRQTKFIQIYALEG